MKSVILDANVLRGISSRDLDAFLAAESRAGILQLQDSWTLFELISHLVKPDDPAFRSSRHAIRIAARRSFFRDSPQILFPSESLVALMLFRENPPGLANTLGLLVECCEEIAEASPDEDLKAVQSTIDEIAHNGARLEAWFADHLADLKRQLLEATAKHLGQADRSTIRRFLRSDLARLDATALIRRAYGQLGKRIPESIPEPHIEAVAEKCAAGTAVLTEAFVMIICDGANLESSKIRNLLWDQELAFPVGQQVKDTRVHLVTNDKVFARALTHIGFERFVSTLDDYLKDIGVADAV